MSVTWTASTSGSAAWAGIEAHPYALETEDDGYYLFTENGLYLGVSTEDGAFWAATTGGSATWSTA